MFKWSDERVRLVRSHDSCSVIFLIVAVFRSCVRIWSFRYNFKAMKDWCLILVFMQLRSFSMWYPNWKWKMKMKMKNLNFSPKGPTTFKIFQFETLFIADYQNVPKFVFDWLAKKLWLKESTIFWNDYTFGWMNLDEYQGVLVCKPSSSFSHKFYIFVDNDYQSLIS